MVGRTLRGILGTGSADPGVGGIDRRERGETQPGRSHADFSNKSAIALKEVPSAFYAVLILIPAVC